MSLLLALIGVAGVPDNLTTWWGWLDDARSTVNGDAVRITLVAVGMALLLISHVAPRVVQLFTASRSERSGSADESALSVRPTAPAKVFDKEQIQSDEKPDFDLEGDIVGEWVHLMVVNNGPTREFRAKVRRITGTVEEQTPNWSIKWRTSTREDRKVVDQEALDFARIYYPGARSSEPAGAIRLYSVSKADGWVVHPSDDEILAIVRVIALDPKEFIQRLVAVGPHGFRVSDLPDWNGILGSLRGLRSQGQSLLGNGEPEMYATWAQGVADFLTDQLGTAESEQFMGADGFYDDGTARRLERLDALIGQVEKERESLA